MKASAGERAPSFVGLSLWINNIYRNTLKPHVWERTFFLFRVLPKPN
jgi:hypothetical protein